MLKRSLIVVIAILALLPARGESAPPPGRLPEQLRSTPTPSTFSTDIAPGSGAQVFFQLETLAPTFADVSPDNFAFQSIEALYAHGITGGCHISPFMFCPDEMVSREQMAVFLVRGIHGSAVQPPTATGAIFDDVPADHPYGRWIEQLFADGITAGCGDDRYCPERIVTRDQMAVFLLRAKYEASYIPPPATGERFSDVPADHPFASWIEQLAAEGITAGCASSRFCPDGSVTRAQMAVFLVHALDLSSADDDSPFVWPPQPSNDSYKPDERYFWLGDGFYAGQCVYRNPLSSLYRYAGRIIGHRVIGGIDIHDYCVWADPGNAPATIRRVLATGTP